MLHVAPLLYLKRSREAALRLADAGVRPSQTGHRLRLRVRSAGPGADGTATTAFVGPVGAAPVERSRLTVGALLRWSAEHATSVIVPVFGPHPSASTLVDAGYRIEDIDTYMASSTRLISLVLYCPSAELG